MALPDVGAPVEELCRLVGSAKENVGRIVIYPDRIEATVFLLNETGRKYVDLDSGEPATEVRTVEVAT